jgi:hypothetical protein
MLQKKQTDEKGAGKGKVKASAIGTSSASHSHLDNIMQKNFLMNLLIWM